MRLRGGCVGGIVMMWLQFGLVSLLVAAHTALSPVLTLFARLLIFPL